MARVVDQADPTKKEAAPPFDLNDAMALEDDEEGLDNEPSGGTVPRALYDKALAIIELISNDNKALRTQVAEVHAFFAFDRLPNPVSGQHLGIMAKPGAIEFSIKRIADENGRRDHSNASLIFTMTRNPPTLDQLKKIPHLGPGALRPLSPSSFFLSFFT
jgi:hypothetical protein